MTLLSQAIAIRDANTVDENTATRVGDWMVDAVGEIDAAQDTADAATVLATVSLRDAITGDFYAKTLADFYFAVEDDGTEGKANAAQIQQLVLNATNLSATGLSGDSANLVVGIANTTSGAVQKITGASLLAPAMNAAAAAQEDATQALSDADSAQDTADNALALAQGIETQLSGYVALAGAQTITGQKTFSSPIVLGTSGAPISDSVTTALFLDGDGKTAQRTLGSLAFASSTAFISNQFATVQAADFAVNRGFFGTSISEGWQIDVNGLLFKTAGSTDALIGIESNDLVFTFDGSSGIVYEAPTGAGTETLAVFQQPTTNKLVSRSLGTGAFATISDYLTTASASATYLTIANASTTYAANTSFKAFAAYRSTSQTVSSGGGYVTLIFDAETYDTANVYDNTTGVFTIPSGEAWVINVEIETDHTDNLFVRLYDVTGTTPVQRGRLTTTGAIPAIGTTVFSPRPQVGAVQYRIEVQQAGGSYDVEGGVGPEITYISAFRITR